MNKAVLGIDLGTSSVKVMMRYRNGDVHTERQAYCEISPDGWLDAIEKAVGRLNVDDVCAVGLSSQVGTYITDEGKVVSWNDNIGKAELGFLKKTYSQQDFVREISMPHPDIISYPLPRLMYIRHQSEDTKQVCQPKDYLCRVMTGRWVTDMYSWRGLANLEYCRYSYGLMDELGLGSIELPPVAGFAQVAGTSNNCSFLPDGIPVYVGLNDFYSSLLGMGITKTGDMFDITGTSEHLGVVEDTIRIETHMVSSPYLYGNVHYGVTASSGASLEFGMGLSDCIDIQKSLSKNPPVFLPYLNGERAPIWDADAKGVFWGITGDTDKNDMAYSVFEGVVFSLYHIYEHMGMPESNSICVAGGASKSRVLNTLKAELFDMPVVTMEDGDTSVVGACIVAAAGEKWYGSIGETAEAFCRTRDVIRNTGTLTDILKKRFETYKSIYPAVRNIK